MPHRIRTPALLAIMALGLVTGQLTSEYLADSDTRLNLG